MNRHDTDEAIQETAARVMSAGVEFVDGDDLFRWASVVSWRIAIDARRRCTRVSGDAVPDRADHVDVAQAAEHRIVLSAVTDRFKDLSARDQAVLRASFGEQATPSRAESVRMAVARHRARNRLRSLLDGLAAPVLGLWARRGRWRSASVEAFASSAAPALACLALTITSLGVMAPLSSSTQSHLIAHAAVAVSAPASLKSKALSMDPATAATATRGNGQRTPSAPKPIVGISLPPGPAGPTRAQVRPKEVSDHLACVTLPSLTGPSTACVDSPVPGH